MAEDLKDQQSDETEPADKTMHFRLESLIETSKKFLRSKKRTQAENNFTSKADTSEE
ncbi:hypothetical protein P0W48_06600 [Plesiomonas shigelloides]|uniref:hypothetical protein n=1 Tax=Plesiomonas shigelloides TaxID=703 RepID=UPI001401F76F|nr:hypothetical protein [Plesiomonas shigelloides]